MAKYEYVLNPKTRRLHLRVDGRSFEQCNLDQIEGAVIAPIPPRDRAYHPCQRCLGTDSGAPIGPA